MKVYPSKSSPLSVPALATADSPETGASCREEVNRPRVVVVMASSRRRHRVGDERTMGQNTLFLSNDVNLRHGGWCYPHSCAFVEQAARERRCLRICLWRLQIGGDAVHGLIGVWGGQRGDKGDPSLVELSLLRGGVSRRRGWLPIAQLENHHRGRRTCCSRVELCCCLLPLVLPRPVGLLLGNR